MERIRAYVDIKPSFFEHAFLDFFSKDVQDRIGGGIETFKTHVTLTSDGKNDWKSPAIFKSLCDVDVTYFPFDVQTCALKFGSWSLNSAQLRMCPENMTNRSSNYVENGEWKVLSMDWKRNVLQYSDNAPAYEDVTLTIEIGRNYFTYFVNLVLPCALISAMIFLGFMLPPECGERISLGITVLLAMTVFQQLTYQIFPSFDIPLLGQYYVATSVEIGLALVATAAILNFSFRKNTKMPPSLRKFIFGPLASLVCLRETIDKSRPKAKVLRKSYRQKSYRRRKLGNQNIGQPTERREDRLVQELRDLRAIPHESFDCGALRYASQAKPNGVCAESTATAFEEHEENADILEDAVDSQTGVLDENGEELDETELALRHWEWSMAAMVLDRAILWISVIIGLVTFLGIFLRAPRVQEMIF